MSKILKDFQIKHPKLKEYATDIDIVASKIVTAYKNKNKVLICGNGGSASDSEHIVGELVKEFRCHRELDSNIAKYLVDNNEVELALRIRGGICAISLVSQTSILTAISNDVGFEYSYAQQVNVYGFDGDILFALSTSGNSVAVVNAVKIARAKGMTIIGFTGEEGGLLKPLCDICFAVNERETYLIQECHLPIYHAICALAEEKIWNK